MNSAISRFAAGTLALAAAVTTAAGGASAEATTWDHVYSSTGATVYVHEHDDYIAVCDTAKNGHSAWMVVAPPAGYGSPYKVTVTAGKGHCKVTRASTGYDLPEDAYIVVAWAGNGEKTQNGIYDHIARFLNDH